MHLNVQSQPPRTSMTDSSPFSPLYVLFDQLHCDFTLFFSLWGWRRPFGKIENPRDMSEFLYIKINAWKKQKYIPNVELQTHCVDYLFHLLDQLCFFSVDSTKSSFYSLYLTGTYFKWLLPASFTQVNSNAEKTRLPFPHFQGWDFKLCRTDFSSSIHSHPTNNYTFNGYCLSSCCYIIGLTK